MVDRIRNYAPSGVSTPGETLRDLLEERSITQAELATRMGRPLKTISEIVNGKAAITPETAQQLELAVGVPADFWNARERDYRAFLARRDEIARLESLKSWCSRFPLKEMTKLRWIPAAADRADVARHLLAFFGVVSPEQWQDLFATPAAAFRRPQKFTPDEHSLSVWLRMGLIVAERTPTAVYDVDKFKQALTAARAMTGDTVAAFSNHLPAECAKAGVVVALVPELTGSRACGATRWISPQKALIQLSLRYKTADHLWFTFFHEAAHILLHGKKLVFLEGTTLDGRPEEEEANRWAGDFLVPPAEFRTFREAGDFSPSAIRLFATRIGVAPGIVVGRLQHDRLADHSYGNGLKVRLKWTEAA